MGTQPLNRVRGFGPPPVMMPGGGQPMMPPQGMMSPATTPPPANPVALLAALKELVGTPIKQPEPIYRPGYVKPKRPDIQEIASIAKTLYENNRQWRMLVFTTLMWVNQELTGSFEEDMTDRALGFKEEYISPRLSAERNLIISKGASLKPSFMVKHAKEELRGWAQRLEDFAIWFRQEEQFQHSGGGNRPLELDEWALFADYGMLTKRHTLAPDRTDCPVRVTLIDPAQVHPVWGPHGLKAVYRVYKDTAEYLTAAYGDFTKSALTKLENEMGKLGDETEIELVEYWDTWYRSVSLSDGTPILPVTEHKYGDVPWTVQFGGHGEPMFTRTPSISTTGWNRNPAGGWTPNSGVRGSERMRKAVPYLYYHLKNHEIVEAVMARMVTALKKDIEPPYIRYRSDIAADGDLPQLDTGPGMGNEARLGEEKIEPILTGNAGMFDRTMGMLGQDWNAISSPPEMSGRIDKSNVTGVAQAGANDAGQHLLFPLTKSWEQAIAHEVDVVARMLGNFGHMPANNDGKKSLLMVPNQRARKGKPAGYVFDREVIEKVGSRVQVTFTKVDPRDFSALFAAGENGVMGGFILPREIRAIATGDHDYDTFFEEWTETKALIDAQSLPEFQKLNIAASILEKIKENEGNPEVQDGYRRMFSIWEQMSAPQPQQPPMGGAPQGMQPPGGMQAPFPQPSQAINPGVPGQVSYPQVGAGPGAEGQQIGRPY